MGAVPLDLQSLSEKGEITQLEYDPVLVEIERDRVVERQLAVIDGIIAEIFRPTAHVDKPVDVIKTAPTKGAVLIKLWSWLTRRKDTPSTGVA